MVNAPIDAERALAEELVRLVGNSLTHLAQDESGRLYVAPNATNAVAQALASAYARGHEEMRERCADLAQGPSSIVAGTRCEDIRREIAATIRALPIGVALSAASAQTG